MRRHWSEIMYIRNASNLRDSFYIEENSFFDQISPMISKRVSDYHTAILESPFLTELRKSYGGGLFTKATESKPPGMEIQETVRMIGTMTHKYQQTLATATVEFNGKRHTLSYLSQLPCSDRDAKRKVAEGQWRLLAHQSATIDELYDGLIKARTEFAHKLGYRDFVEYSHHRIIGYSVEQLEELRQQVRDHTVPETRYPRDDIAEIHSIGLELLTWPWMDRIFGSEAEKYRYLHMSELITSIPYGACVSVLSRARRLAIQAKEMDV